MSRSVEGNVELSTGPRRRRRLLSRRGWECVYWPAANKLKKNARGSQDKRAKQRTAKIGSWWWERKVAADVTGEEQEENNKRESTKSQDKRGRVICDQVNKRW